MADHIKIRKAQGTWVVRVGGAVVGESSAALELSEGSYPEVIYFPRGDIAMAFLDTSDKVTHCPHKGDTVYFNIVTKSTTLENAAWSYEAPKEDVAAIAGHLAFHHADVTVEKL
ncbi:MAG: DUF427 domain-containing protein [Pseudomonadota bacterium]